MCPQFKSGPRHLREFQFPGPSFAALRSVRNRPSFSQETDSQLPIRLAMGDRLMAGLRSLEPSIGVRIPVPQPSPVRGPPHAVLNAVGMQYCSKTTKYGAYSSKAERLIVDQKVAGSSPARRPGVRLSLASWSERRLNRMSF